MFNVVANIPQVLLIWFQCSPPSALWDPLRQSQCDHRKSVYYTYFVGAVAALSDFYLAIIPISMFMPLRIDRRLKWGLYFLMGCGVFAGVAAIVRTWAAKFIMAEDSSCKNSLPTTYTAPRIFHLNTISIFTDGVAILFLWGEVEEWIVLITMCIPPVWPLFRPFAQRFLETTTSRSQSRPHNYTPYYRTDQEGNSSGMWPPRVTTTISVSSATGTTTTAVPSGKSSDSITKHCDQAGEPYNEFHDRNMQETWVELPDLEERSILDSHHPPVSRR